LGKARADRGKDQPGDGFRVFGNDNLQADSRPLHVNLETGRGFSVREVIEVARSLTGRSIEARTEPSRPGDPPRLEADASQASNVLGWKPEIDDLAVIIHSTWAWQQSHPDGYR
jgi:UDP-glucose 4-epimerase